MGLEGGRRSRRKGLRASWQPCGPGARLTCPATLLRDERGTASRKCPFERPTVVVVSTGMHARWRAAQLREAREGVRAGRGPERLRHTCVSLTAPQGGQTHREVAGPAVGGRHFGQPPTAACYFGSADEAISKTKNVLLRPRHYRAYYRANASQKLTGHAIEVTFRYPCTGT